MAYSELIKNFEKVRAYMREFYVYGFKSREQYDRKSLRSYDEEKRRIESYLGDFMGFRTSDEGKTVFLSIDSRTNRHNPLYKALKAKSFTNGDIILHFYILDILNDYDVCRAPNEITDIISSEYLTEFDFFKVFDESTVRKKLKEYVSLGLLETLNDGKRVLYRRAKEIDISPLSDAIGFFSEVSPCGALGSFMLDRNLDSNAFTFKHHYITHAMDSDVLCDLFLAMSDRRRTVLEVLKREGQENIHSRVLPLKILISVSNGREYLACYDFDRSTLVTFRIDRIVGVMHGEVDSDYEMYRERFSTLQKHMWGVMCFENQESLEHVEFTVHIDDNEEFIAKRLDREKRCGNVERIDEHTLKFSADVLDSIELIPWIRTFICRIESIEFSNPKAKAQLLDDLDGMYRQYGISLSKEVL